MSGENTERKLYHEEKIKKGASGMLMLVLNIILMVAAILAVLYGFMAGSVLIIVGGFLYLCIVGPILFCGLKVIRPNEALVMTLFGKYYGTLKGEGFYFVNPFVVGLNPAVSSASLGEQLSETLAEGQKGGKGSGAQKGSRSKKISLKAITLNNDKQKINDQLGNPIIIGIVVIWRVVNTAKAAFNVDNYAEYLSTQCDSALRNIVRLYPYDIPVGEHVDGDEKSLRGSSQEVAERLKEEIQSRVDLAGLEIMEARITHLAYAPEIAAAMLQRQQASAIVAARKLIVEGAVGMVDLALKRLNENEIVDLDEERKAQMVSNLMVVLCGNKDAQPIVNSGSLY
ncbi:MAG: SPFH domain-containing protein [Bacillota bacterium]|nr:SPFH domain-containing protein [Bacillota bacterium]